MKRRAIQYLAFALLAAVVCMELLHWDDARIDRISEIADSILRGSFGRRYSYENWDNETVRQSVAHHWWFSWLTENR